MMLSMHVLCTIFLASGASFGNRWSVALDIADCARAHHNEHFGVLEISEMVVDVPSISAE